MRHLLFAATAALLAVPAGAATINVDAGVRLGTLSFYSPVGQSFLAPGAVLQTIGLQFGTLNPGNAGGPITVNLLQGAGLSGAVLATRTFTPGTLTGTPPIAFTNFDFSGITLTPGAAYTVTASSTSSYNAIVFGPNLINPPYGQTFTADAYTDGSLYAASYFGSQIGGCGSNPTSCDLNFRVVTADSPAGAVPEPASWAMLIAGFGLVGAGMRRRAGVRAIVQAI